MDIENGSIKVTQRVYDFLTSCFPDGIYDVDDVQDSMYGHKIKGILLRDMEVLLANVNTQTFKIEVGGWIFTPPLIVY